MTPRVEPGALCHHNNCMKRLALIAALFSAAGLLRAEDKAASPAAAATPLQISADDGGALTEKSGTSNPKMNKEVDVASVPESEGPFDIEPPPGSPDPAKTAEITGPLPGDEEPRPLPPVAGTVEITAKDNNRVVAAKVGEEAGVAPGPLLIVMLLAIALMTWLHLKRLASDILMLVLAGGASLLLLSILGPPA